MPRSTRSTRAVTNPIQPQNPGHPSPVQEEIGAGDARIVIEANQHRHAQIPGMDHLTPEQLAEAIRMYRNRSLNPHDPDVHESQHPAHSQPAQNSQGSGNSRHTRVSVFGRLGDQPKKTAQKAQSQLRNLEAERLKKRAELTELLRREEEAERQRKLAELTDQIRQEEEAKLELVIQKRIREEEEKLRGSGPTYSRRPGIVISPEPLSPRFAQEEPESDLLRMVQELQRKVGAESGLDIEGTLTPFSRALEGMPRQEAIKHYNFDSFDGLSDPEEHIHYFEQISLIYSYNDITKCRFFASTLKGGAQRWFSRIPSRSIHSWKEFRESFLRRFRANRTTEFHMCHLETIRQYDNESLSAYMR